MTSTQFEKRSFDCRWSRRRQPSGWAVTQGLRGAVGHVATGLTLTTLGAEATTRLLDDEPEGNSGPACQVAQSGWEALAELRLLLGVLREGTEVPVPAAVGSSCALATVVERFAGAGLEVDLQVSGRRRPLEVLLELALAAIVTEGLTTWPSARRLVGARSGSASEPPRWW